MRALPLSLPTNPGFRLPLPELSLLLVAAFWGTSYGVTKEALAYTGALAFIAIRFGMTALILAPLHLREIFAGKAADCLRALPTGILLLCIFVAETWGVFHTSATRAAFLISLCVLITPLLQGLIERRWPRAQLLGLVLLSLLGVGLLTQAGVQGEDTGWRMNLRDYLMLLAALLRAVLVVTTNRLFNGRALSALAITSTQSWVVTLGALAFFALGDAPASELFPLHGEFWWAAVYLTLCCTLYALFAQNYGLKHTSPSRVALLTGSEPAFGALFAFLWLGETLTPVQLLGAGCILLSTLIATLQRRH
ncbi:DMT family transporter [Marinobacterium lutimaris]|uniref:Threonine/homoserine efflux transporter RhtA n=1 Tax=Marinobacterium lutimaris TaxID=568106 RepID=A0A1H5X3A5_9GAMM|nr:DMT family transporter [Marinobacterium lutimaris]SEG06329.1 Threonine/homoserine efflux transporter RhtA [Marinobacterium lutimaris]